MRGALLLALAFGGVSRPALAWTPEDAGRHTVRLTVTGTIQSEGAHSLLDPDERLFGTPCEITGTGFIVSEEGHVITARHLLTDQKCEGAGMEGRYLGRVRISARRGAVNREGDDGIAGHFSEEDAIPSEDIAMIVLDPTSPRYRPLRVCASPLSNGDYVESFGYLGNGPLAKRDGNYDHNQNYNGEVRRLSFGFLSGDGMSGGPVLRGDRVVSMLVSSELNNVNVTYGTAFAPIEYLIERETTIDVRNCDRNPEGLERIGLLLERAAFSLSMVQTGAGRSEENATAVAQFVADYSSNRNYFAREFFANETRLIDILGASRRDAIEREGFYNNQARFFELVSASRSTAGEGYASAVEAYSDNAWLLGKFDAAQGVLDEALQDRPRSLAIMDILLDRYAEIDQFEEIIRFVENRPYLLDYEPPDASEQRLLIKILDKYAWALWERGQGQDYQNSDALFTRLLDNLNRWPGLGADLRFSILNNRAPLYVVTGRAEVAARDARIALEGYRGLFNEATADQRETAAREYEHYMNAAESNLSWAYSEMGDLSRARTHAQAALERKLSARVISPLSIAVSLQNLGSFDVRLNNVQVGLENLRGAEAHFDQFREYGSFYAVRAARLQKEIGFAHLQLGQRPEALTRLLRGLRELGRERQQLTPDYLRNQVLLGYYYLEGNEVHDAEVSLRAARRTLEQIDQDPTARSDIENLLDLFLGEALIRGGATEPGVASVQIAVEGMVSADRTATYVLYFPRAQLVERARRVLAANAPRAP